MNMSIFAVVLGLTVVGGVILVLGVSGAIAAPVTEDVESEMHPAEGLASTIDHMTDHMPGEWWNHSPGHDHHHDEHMDDHDHYHDEHKNQHDNKSHHHTGDGHC